ncbi:sulfurtransferase complex subunit TusB [Vreelandella massiliensis]|uniref:sulfurtransferase complex subunit TusB n=1 Tax=Vreelandella massiliensis TaxID=1816686 RepID=UPI00096AC6F1|nr:sulfurtransferase complex subunit TusB [Halomonas massiliensis]
MRLHIVNRAPQFNRASSQALRAMGPDDKLVLIEDAVVAVLEREWQGWTLAPERVFVMEEDLSMRGLLDMVAPHQRVNVDALVQLTAECEQTISWH